MSPEPSIEEFAEVFLHSRAMKGPRAKILRAHFDSPDYIATMSQLAQRSDTKISMQRTSNMEN